MGCNCGNKNAKVDWVYTNTNGVQKSYTTEIEANAAKIRAGGTGSVRSVPKR